MCSGKKCDVGCGIDVPIPFIRIFLIVKIRQDCLIVFKEQKYIFDHRVDAIHNKSVMHLSMLTPRARGG